MTGPLIIGHRGAPYQAVENTEAAFQAALETGAGIIETDVRLTADGHLVIAHDPDYSRLGGPVKPIIDCSRDELEKIVLKGISGNVSNPLFMEQALQLFPRAAFSVDLKDPGPAVVKVWTELLQKSGASSRCRTASFRDRTLKLFHRLNPDAPISIGRFGAAWLLFTTVLGCPRRPKSWEGVLQLPERAGPIRVLTPKRISLWQTRGWKVQVWTVDNKEDMRRFVRWGIDGIITNRPSLLLEVMKPSSD